MIAAHYDLPIRHPPIRHVDIKCALLNGDRSDDVKEEVYAEQPPLQGHGDRRYVWRLKEALYGLKQAPRQWHKELKQKLQAIGFVRSAYDPALFIHMKASGVVVVHVDDPIFAASDDILKTMIGALLNAFNGREVSWLLGMAVKRDRSQRAVTLSQKQMIDNVLVRFGMMDCKPVGTPLKSGAHIGRNPHERELYYIREELKDSHSRSSDEFVALEDQKTQRIEACVDLSSDEQKLYTHLVAAIQHLTVVTGPDTAFAASMLARCMSHPTIRIYGQARSDPCLGPPAKGYAKNSMEIESCA